MSCSANLPVNVTCAIGDGVCTAVNATLSECTCDAGRIGDSCDTLKMGLTWIYALDFVLFSGLFLLTAAYVYYMWTRMGWREEFKAARFRGVRSSHPKIYGNRTILVWRFVWFGVFLGIQLNQLILFPTAIEAFTVWNSVLIITYLGFGTAISAAKELKGEAYIEESAYWRINANVHWILQEVELTNAFIVSIVFWAFLFPPCGAACAQYTSVIQHAMNFVVMLIDFLMCSHTTNLFHVPFPVCWIALYALFHTCLMLSIDNTIGHQPKYFFLDNSSPVKLGWTVGILILINVVYGAFWALSKYLLKRPAEAPTEGDGVQLAVTDQKVEDSEA